jgi:DNA polymerase
MISDGTAVYEAHARATMGWTGGVLRNEDPAQYALAKARVLALGYQAGWEKFITMAQTLAGLDITEGDPQWEIPPEVDMMHPNGVPGYGMFARKCVTEFREQNPKIVSLWSALDAGFKGSVGGNYEIELPSGRMMRYEDIRCETRIEPDPKTKRPTRKSVYTANVGGKRVPFYGGKLAENITQAASRDVFAEHLLALDSTPGCDVLFSVHDEAVNEVDEGLTARDIEATMSVCPPWLEGCPIGAEAKEIEHYEK